MHAAPHPSRVCAAPLLFVLSGPSGAGKDAVLRRLKGTLPDLHYAVTATTRAPRPGEVLGESYHFLDRRQYDRMLADGELLAPAQVHGHYYGVPRREVCAPLRAGHDVIVKLDVQGAELLRRRLPGAVYVFLAPSSFGELVERLTARDTESQPERERRIQAARFEMSQMPFYDYLVLNRHRRLEAAVTALACIVGAERLRLHRRPIDLDTC